MGMKNHEVVPLALVSSVGGLSVSLCERIAHDLVKHKLCSYEHKKGKFIIIDCIHLASLYQTCENYRVVLLLLLFYCCCSYWLSIDIYGL